MSECQQRKAHFVPSEASYGNTTEKPPVYAISLPLASLLKVPFFACSSRISTLLFSTDVLMLGIVGIYSGFLNFSVIADAIFLRFSSLFGLTYPLPLAHLPEIILGSTTEPLFCAGL